MINTAPLLENYRGFDSAPGLQFGMKLQEQLDKLNVKVEMQEITDIDKIEKGFLLRNNEFSLVAKAIIINNCADFIRVSFKILIIASFLDFYKRIKLISNYKVTL